MVVEDETYVRWLAWIRDYAKTVSDGYRDEDQLPATDGEDSVLADLWIRINSDTSWMGYGAKIEIYAWDEKASAFEDRRCASTVRAAGPKGGPAGGLAGGRAWPHRPLPRPPASAARATV